MKENVFLLTLNLSTERSGGKNTESWMCPVKNHVELVQTKQVRIQGFLRGPQDISGSYCFGPSKVITVVQSRAGLRVEDVKLTCRSEATCTGTRWWKGGIPGILEGLDHAGVVAELTRQTRRY